MKVLFLVMLVLAQSPRPPRCAIQREDRTPCPDIETLNKKSCLAANCCWSSKNNVGFCFAPVEITRTSTTATSSTTTDELKSLAPTLSKSSEKSQNIGKKIGIIAGGIAGGILGLGLVALLYQKLFSKNEEPSVASLKTEEDQPQLQLHDYWLTSSETRPDNHNQIYNSNLPYMPPNVYRPNFFAGSQYQRSNYDSRDFQH